MRVIQYAPKYKIFVHSILDRFQYKADGVDLPNPLDKLYSLVHFSCTEYAIHLCSYHSTFDQNCLPHNDKHYHLPILKRQRPFGCQAEESHPWRSPTRFCHPPDQFLFVRCAVAVERFYFALRLWRSWWSRRSVLALQERKNLSVSRMNIGWMRWTQRLYQNNYRNSIQYSTSM